MNNINFEVRQQQPLVEQIWATCDGCDNTVSTVRTNGKITRHNPFLGWRKVGNGQFCTECLKDKKLAAIL